MSSYAIAQIDRMVREAESVQGMQAGIPKARVDTSLLRHVIIHYERLEAEVATKDARIAELAERLNIAEAKLTRLGYEHECNIPACNCGAGWTHRRTEV